MSDDSAASSARTWVVFPLLGIVMVLLGIGCIVYSFASTVLSVIVFGVILIVKALLVMAKTSAHCLHGQQVTKLSTVGHLCIALIALICGALFILLPLVGAIDLTLLLSLFLIVGGGVQLAMGCGSNPAYESLYWLGFNGLLNVALGVFVLVNWPGDSFWILGLLLGVEIIAYGSAVTFAGFSLRTSTAHRSSRLRPENLPALWWGLFHQSSLTHFLSFRVS